MPDPKALSALKQDEDAKVKDVYDDFNKGRKSLFDLVAECARMLVNASYREVTTFRSNKIKQRKLRKLEAAIAAFKEYAEEAQTKEKTAAVLEE